MALTENNPFFHESVARRAGYGLIAGVDEAGRGPLAGPVVAAAVILPDGISLPGVKDSKKMTAKGREDAFSMIIQKAIAIGVGAVSPEFIDKFNILKASLESMKRALLSLEPAPEYILVDGIHAVPVSTPQKCLKKGDQISRSISAASVLAKVYRDRLMRSYDELFPEYGFLRHQRYGTKQYMSAIKLYGPSPIHRLTFRGVRGIAVRSK